MSRTIAYPLVVVVVLVICFFLQPRNKPDNFDSNQIEKSTEAQSFAADLLAPPQFARQAEIELSIEEIEQMLNQPILGYLSGNSEFASVLESPIKMLRRDPDGRLVLAMLEIYSAEDLLFLLGLDWRTNVQDGICKMFEKKFQTQQERQEFVDSINWKQFLTRGFEILSKNHPERVAKIDFQEILSRRFEETKQEVAD